MCPVVKGKLAGVKARLITKLITVFYSHYFLPYFFERPMQACVNVFIDLLDVTSRLCNFYVTSEQINDTNDTFLSDSLVLCTDYRVLIKLW